MKSAKDCRYHPEHVPCNCLHFVSAALSRKLRQAEDCLRSGDASGAESLCELILRQAPRNPDALHLLGVAQLSLGRPRDALTALDRALAVDRHNGAALEHSGLAHLMLGQFAAAEKALASAAQLPGAPASVFMRLGVAVLEQGRASDSLPALRRAIALDPNDTDSHLNLGRALAGTGEVAAASEHFQTALELTPRCADAAFNLGVLAMQQGEAEQARKQYLAALRIAPDLIAAHEGLASVCVALGRIGEAIPHLRAMTAAQPDNAEALSMLAGALYALGQLDEASAAARRVVELSPGDASAYATIANIHLVRGELEAAIQTLESGYQRTNAGGLLGMLTYQLRHVCDWAKWRTAWEAMAREIDHSGALGSPFWLLCEPTTAEQQLAYTRHWAAARFDRLTALPPVAKRTSPESSRVRIGYLSSDLHEHATAYLIADVLEQHDRGRFEVFAYSYGPDDGSPMRRRLQAACEHFVDIAWEPDDIAARHIQSDMLDVLVDLKGYTLGDRLTIMARRPCDIQVTWLGYPGTTGAPCIDYVIADAFVIPPDAESAYSERVVRLPHCYQPNDRKRAVAETLSRADYGLPEGAFVFCCFNQTYKITPEVFAVWMQLLRSVPDSVLWLFESNAWAKENLLEFARGSGIGEERLVFAPRLPNAQHLARYRAADLALDTFPYTSHTTLSDALWCGCPAVALCGDTFAARVSGSLLTAAGLPDQVTYSLADYEELARRLATDRALLAAMRTRVVRSRDDSPLFDSAALTRALEGLYANLLTHHRASA